MVLKSALLIFLAPGALSPLADDEVAGKVSASEAGAWAGLWAAPLVDLELALSGFRCITLGMRLSWVRALPRGWLQ